MSAPSTSGHTTDGRYAATAWCIERCARRVGDVASSTTMDARVVNQRWVDYWADAAVKVAQGADILMSTGLRWPIEAELA